MRTTIKRALVVGFLAGCFALAGCSHMQNAEISNLKQQLTKKDQELKTLRAGNEEIQRTLEQRDMELKGQSMAALQAEAKARAALEAKEAAEKSRSAKALPSEAPLLPPLAKPGDCYARVFVPPTYKTFTEQVLKQGASERVEVIPAKHEWVEEKVQIQAASERLEVIPAEYGFVEEKVLMKEASTRMEEVPAAFEWVEDRVLVRPAETGWKKGRGLIEKVDNTTGEIMCLVEIPASYRTVKKKVMTKPPSTRVVEIPAEYKTIKRKVVVKPATTRVVEIPAKYSTVKIRKLVSPPEERRISIPAEYQTITRTEQVSEGRLEWRRVLCETNMSPTVISQIQTALLKAGHDPGPIDGIIGQRTLAATKAYQKGKGLAVGALTYRTLESLGVKIAQ
ncbi:MAG: peptidoglycan-binding protein [Deltaproteobacteria bacterium]|nr:peptidoglycan-binding protein [Deltaproteobacteria bacterium]